MIIWQTPPPPMAGHVICERPLMHVVGILFLRYAIHSLDDWTEKFQENCTEKKYSIGRSNFSLEHFLCIFTGFFLFITQVSKTSFSDPSQISLLIRTKLFFFLIENYLLYIYLDIHIYLGTTHSSKFSKRNCIYPLHSQKVVTYFGQITP